MFRFSGGYLFRTAEMLPEKTSIGQTPRRAGRRERHGYAMEIGDRPGVA